LKRSEYGEEADHFKARTDKRAAPEMWEPTQVRINFCSAKHLFNNLSKWIQDAWRSDKYEKPSGAAPFPPDDLIRSLIGLFFRHVNPTFPILDREEFENAFNEGLYQTSTQNEALVLLVCSIGSIYSNDPRIASNLGNTPQDGWRYFIRGRDWVQSLTPATLAELQIMAVSGLAQYALLGTQSHSKKY
jgi:hypothetical protein